MSDTLFYKLKLKTVKTPYELYEKMKRSVKKKGTTKNWTCDVGENGEYFRIDFGDGKSEEFLIEFDEKRVCSGFCKVDFPLEGDAFEDEKKSEFKALLNMLYSAKSFFTKMEITDDFGLAESFIDSKKYKIGLRELSANELERAERLFNEGNTGLRRFIISLLFDLRGLPYAENYKTLINKQSNYINWDREPPYFEEHEYISGFIVSFLHETAEYKDTGLLRDNADYISCDLNSVMFSVGAFDIGISEFFSDIEHHRGMDQKSSQILKLFYHTLKPLIDAETNDFNKCVLVYRYFVSIYDWLGFKYIGHNNESEV